MNNIRVIRNCFAMLVFLITLIYLILQWFNLPRYQEREIDKVLEKLSVEFAQKEREEETIKQIEGSDFVAVFRKDDNKKLIPIVYNVYFFPDGMQNIAETYEQNKKRIRFYSRTIAEYDYLVWVKRVNFDYIIKYLMIPVLVSAFLFILGVMIIGAMFSPSKRISSEEDEISIEEEAQYITEELEHSWSKDSLEERRQEEEEENPLDAYKILWSRNFKISDDFREKFPFYRMIRLFRFSYTPEEYLNKGIKIAAEYFHWTEPAVYISQKEEFINSETRESLDKAKIVIPSDGMEKGDIYIPLFPYSKSKIFGYLKFCWQRDEGFQIADILYFLKFLLSKEAKIIFTNHRNNLNMKERLDEIIKTNEEATVCFMEVDQKERFNVDLTDDEINILNMKVLDDIMQGFCGYIVFEAFPFVYGLCETINQEMMRADIEKFMTEAVHNYFISPVRGNIAVTFSVGMASKAEKNIQALDLIRQAEEYLDKAIENGGDQICGR